MLLVMIVEDNNDDALSLETMLISAGLEATVIKCARGEMALEYIDSTQEEIDLFFIDVMLPTINGYTVAEEIRSRKRYIITPIVFITGFNTDELSAYQKYHCYGFIQKPINTVQIKNQLLNLLNATKENKALECITSNQLINIKTRDGISFIYLHNLLSIEVTGKDCVIHTMNDKYVVPRVTLDALIRDIGIPSVIRCHKSFGVNVLNVKGLVKKKRNIWQPIYRDIDSDVNNCLISGTYYDAVMDCFNRTIADNRAIEQS